MPAYLLRFLDILRSREGAPLLKHRRAAELLRSLVARTDEILRA